jgi:hypothetical protein
VTSEELRTSLHESGHATMAVHLGLAVGVVSRVCDRPDVLGFCSLPGFTDGLDKERARKYAKVLLAGAIMSDGDIPDWPLSRTATNDELLLAVLTDILGFDERDWLDLRIETLNTTCETEFVARFTALTGLLDTYPAVDERHIRMVEQIGGAR